MFAMHKLFIPVFLLLFFNSCTNKKTSTEPLQNNMVAILDNDSIYLNQIDSIIGLQIYEQRLNALQMLIGRKILETEAQKNNITLNQLVEEQINKKCKEVTRNDIEAYISRTNVEPVDTNNIMSYLLTVKQNERQMLYIDSLKQYNPFKIKLRPPFYNTIETKNILSQNISSSDKANLDVFIVSDFDCPNCQKAERDLKGIYEKYRETVNFKFVYFSSYIDQSIMACEAAANQNRFKEMHDKIFDNASLLHQDSIFFQFARELGLNMDTFSKDMQGNGNLKKLKENAQYLMANKIYSTPTFIVNGKILNNKYAIHYLEDVINEELK